MPAIAASHNIIPSNTEAGGAGEDLTGDSRKFLKRASDGDFEVAGTQGMIVAGVLMNEPQADVSSPETQFIPELAKRNVIIGVVSGAACTLNAFCTNDTSGKAIDAVEGNTIHGVFVSSVDGANKLVMVDLNINSGTYLVADN